MTTGASVSVLFRIRTLQVRAFPLFGKRSALKVWDEACVTPYDPPMARALSLLYDPGTRSCAEVCARRHLRFLGTPVSKHLSARAFSAKDKKEMRKKKS